jgi:hypothetical protein
MSSIYHQLERYRSTWKCGWLDEVAGRLRKGVQEGTFVAPVWPGSDRFEVARARVITRVAEAIAANPMAAEIPDDAFEPGHEEIENAEFRDLRHARAFARAVERDLRQRSSLSSCAVEGMKRCSVPVFLLNNQDEDEATLGRLEITLWSDQNAQVFPAPTMAFVTTDLRWDAALQDSVTHANVSGQSVQWHLTITGQEWFQLDGGSAGGAVRLALRQILEPGESLPIGGVAMMCAIRKNGQLGSIDPVGLEGKIRSAIQRSLPRFHTIVLAEEQKALNKLILDDGRLEGARVIYAETFDAACAELERYLHQDWDRIPDVVYSAERRRHETLIQRRHLDDALDAQFKACKDASRRSGGLGLVAPAFFGKSAFAASWFGPDPVKGSFVVSGHFFREGHSTLRSGSAAVRSIALQLRRLHGLKRPGFGEDVPNLQGFLNDAGEKALEKDLWQLIVLDGLDEMDPKDRLLVERAFPETLPPGCFLLTTSRPGGEIPLFERLPGFKTLRIDPEHQDSRGEIRGLLDLLNAGFHPPLEGSLLDRLAESCEGLLGVAFLLTVRNPRFDEDVKTWHTNPDSLPKGLEEVVVREWQRILRFAKESMGEQSFSGYSVRALLGCLALTGELTVGELKSLIRQIAPSSWSDPFQHGDLSLRVLDPVLSAARIFFDPVPGHVAADQAGLRYWHTAFPQFILGRLPLTRPCANGFNPFLDKSQVKSLHRVLASSALGLWESEEPAKDWAVRQVCTHLRGADMGEEWAKLLLECPEFLFRRVETGSAFDLFEDFPDEEEAKELGVAADLALALGRIRAVLSRRGHFIDQAGDGMPLP